MAITLTDLRTLIDEGDSLTGWTGHDTLGTSDPTPIEASGWVGANVGVEIFVGYHTITATDLSDAVIYAWVFSRLSLGNTADANGGLMIMLADATPDRIGYKVNGADKAAFRHDEGPTGWQCPALDTTSLPTSPYVSAGAAGNIDLTNITEVGTIVNSLVAAPGMNPTYNVDIMRYLDPTANNGCAADITGGASGGTEGTFAEIAAADRLTGNLQAHGLVRQLAAGAFGAQGPLRFGNATGSSSSWFEDSNVSFIFEDRGFRTDLYKIFITDNGTGTTTFRLHGCALIAPSGVGAEFDADTDTDVTDVVLDTGTRISGFTNGVGLRTGHIFEGIITGSGQVRANGATMNRSSVLQSTVAANNSSLQWNVNTDPDGLLDDMTFDKTSGVAHHAIEFGTAIADAAEFTLRGCAFGTDFSATAGGTTGDETFHFLDTTGSITLNLVGCTGNKGYRTNGVSVTIVDDPVTTQYTVTDTDQVAISGARVFLETSDGTGPLPFEESVSIVQTAGTATVTHTAHGIPDGTQVVIRGATQNGYNKVAVITVTGVNSYTYAVDSGTVSPATGSPVASGVIIHTTTNGSGVVSDTRVFSSDQPFKGTIRASSGAPYYQPATLTGTISSTSGFTASVSLLLDQ